MSWKQKKRCLDLLATEDGWSRKVWGEPLAVCLAYPNLYRTGMSNLGFQTVYALINRHPGALCERVFLPEPGDEAPHGEGVSLISIESQRPLSEFDIVAFSLSFENDYLQLLRMLQLAGIPLEAAHRGEQHPLVMGGGIAVTLNPEPLADLFDLFLLGEGEAVLPRFLDLAASLKRTFPREAFLARVQKEIAGAYVPRFYRVILGENRLITAREPVDPLFPRRIARQWIADLDPLATEQQIITEATELGGMYLTEVSRGCGRGCRFCAAGFVCRPVRFRSPEALASSFRRGLQKGKTIGLLGTAVSDHPALLSLCRSILADRGRVAIGSLRIDRITRETATILKAAGVETVSLAPEAGSQRLRDLIHKGITEEEILSAVEKLMEFGILQAKLYFMVGLPTETDDDAEAIVRLVEGMRDHARKSSAGRRGFRRLSVGINQFVPKAATPFQWHPLEDAAVVRRRVRRIKEGLRSEKTVRVTHDSPKGTYIQALLALGDRRAAKFLIAAHRLDGNWSRALREVHDDANFYVCRRKETSELLPWDFIDHGIPKDDLLQLYRKSLGANDDPMTGTDSRLHASANP